MQLSWGMAAALAAGLIGAAPGAGAQTADYRLFPRDLVRVSVLGEPEMTAERRIEGDGSVELPLIGSVKLANLTAAQAQDEIRRLYQQREFFVHPEIAVAVVTYAPKEVSVMGQVRNPGAVAFPAQDDQLSIADAISRAGGFTRIGRADAVRVTRSGAGGQTETYNVNVKDMLNGRDRSGAFLLRPGDVVFVPESAF